MRKKYFDYFICKTSIFSSSNLTVENQWTRNYNEITVNNMFLTYNNLIKQRYFIIYCIYIL